MVITEILVHTKTISLRHNNFFWGGYIAYGDIKTSLPLSFHSEVLMTLKYTLLFQQQQKREIQEMN